MVGRNRAAAAVAAIVVVAACALDVTRANSLDAEFAVAQAAAITGALRASRHHGQCGGAGGAPPATRVGDLDMQTHTSLVDNDDASRGTYQQRYFVNSSYVRSSVGKPPVLVVVGGEMQLETWWTILGPQVEHLAQLYGGVIVGIEHRYFGTSLPTSLDTANLAGLLTVEQAVADLVSFRYAMEGVGPMSHGSKWVLFGCSYSGVVAAYARTAHPEAFLGAVASSAPVEPEADFHQYNDVLMDSMRAPVAGGSDACATTITEASQQMGQLIATGADGVAKLGRMFNSCTPLSTAKDGAFLMRGVLDTTLGFHIVQSTVPYNLIGYVCNVLARAPGSTALDKLAAWATSVGTCDDDFGYAEYVAYLRSNETSIEDWDKQYQYLQCTQFGWFHTCDGGDCPFPPLLPLSFYQDLCSDGFGLAANATAVGAAALKARYGGRSPSTSVTNVQFGELAAPASLCSAWVGCRAVCACARSLALLVSDRRLASTCLCNLFGTTRIAVTAFTHRPWTTPGLAAVAGQLDPWTALTVTTLPAGSQLPKPIVMPDGSHCSNTAVSPYDPPGVVAAQAAVRDEVGRWLYGL